MGSCQCRRAWCGEQEQVIQQEIATQEEIITKTQNELQIKIRTWQKESFSLFDYENDTNLREQNLKVRDYYQQITEGGYLIKVNNDIEWVTECHVKQEQVLFQIDRVKDQYVILNSRQKGKSNYEDEKVEQMTKYNNHEKSENLEQFEGEEFQPEHGKILSQRTNTKVMEKGSKLWLVLRSSQQMLSHKSLKLKVGDIIKMGRVKFKLIEINLNQRKQLLHMTESIASQDGNETACRVCLSTQTTILNPLVNPCKCNGSMKYIHLECLKKWLRSKLHTRQSEHCIILMWKHLECELCKFNYPPVFRSDDAFYDLVELSKPTDIPYILMEITQKRYDDHEPQGDDQASRCNGVYIISFATLKELKIGRANETEIRVNDISVSRNHASLKVIDNNLYLSDTRSKFGTLLLLQRSLPLLRQLNGVELQVGRSVMQFQMSGEKVALEESIFEEVMGRGVSDDYDD